MFFRSRTLNIDLITEWGLEEHVRDILPVHLAAPWWAAAAAVSGFPKQLLQERLGKEFKLGPAVKPEAVGSLQALLPLFAQNVPNRMLAVAHQRTGKGFSSIYIFWLAIVWSFTNPKCSHERQCQWQQRILWRWRPRPHMSWKTTNVANWEPNSSFLETGTLSTATENGPTPRLDGLLMVQNLQGTMSTNQYMSTKTCSERNLS